MTRIRKPSFYGPCSCYASLHIVETHEGYLRYEIQPLQNDAGVYYYNYIDAMPSLNSSTCN